MSTLKGPLATRTTGSSPEGAPNFRKLMEAQKGPGKKKSFDKGLRDRDEGCLGLKGLGFRMVCSWGADVDEASRPGFNVEGFQEWRFESVSLSFRVSKCLRFRTLGLSLEIVDLQHIC